MKKTIVGFLVAALAVLSFSCQNSAMTGSSNLGATVKISFATNSRAVVANWSTAVTSYQVSLTSNSGYTSQSTTVTSGTSATFSSVTPGSWNVSVTALSGSSIVGSGSLSNQTITGGASLNLTVPVSASQTGTGGFSFNFAYPSSTSINYVSAQLYNSSGTAVGSAIVPTLTASGSNETGTIAQTSIASGNYRLQLTFKRGGASGTIAGIYSETVNVWDNVTSDQWLDSSGKLNAQRSFSVSDFNSTASALSNLVVSSSGTALTLSPGFSSLTLGYSAIITASSTVNITATQSIGGQNIQYQVGSTTGTWTNLSSGTSSSSISLTSSSTVMYVKVTANDQVTTTTYQVTVSTPTVTFNSEGGSSVASQAVTLATMTLGSNFPADPTKSGYFFAGWYTNSGGPDAGGTRFTASTAVTGNITIYALWVSTTWTSSASLPALTTSGDSWTSVTYGNGNFVAISYKGIIVYSSDGSVWTKATTGPSTMYRWNAIAYGTPGGKGRFVALASAGDQAVTYSDDNGATWTTSTSGLPSGVNQAWMSLVYGSNKYVAVASNEESTGLGIMYSSDGITWTSATGIAAELKTPFLSSVTYGNGVFVAVTSVPETNQNIFAYSTDGNTWSSSSSIPTAYWVSVTYGNGVFVAVANYNSDPLNNACVAYSSDGKNWSSSFTAIPSGNKWFSVAYGDGVYIAVASDTTTLEYSANGSTWTSEGSLASASWQSVAYGGGKFVAITNANSQEVAVLSP